MNHGCCWSRISNYVTWGNRQEESCFTINSYDHCILTPNQRRDAEPIELQQAKSKSQAGFRNKGSFFFLPFSAISDLLVAIIILVWFMETLCSYFVFKCYVMLCILGHSLSWIYKFLFIDSSCSLGRDPLRKHRPQPRLSIQLPNRRLHGTIQRSVPLWAAGSQQGQDLVRVRNRRLPLDEHPRPDSLDRHQRAQDPVRQPVSKPGPADRACVHWPPGLLHEVRPHGDQRVQVLRVPRGQHGLMKTAAFVTAFSRTAKDHRTWICIKNGRMENWHCSILIKMNRFWTLKDFRNWIVIQQQNGNGSVFLSSSVTRTYIYSYHTHSEEWGRSSHILHKFNTLPAGITLHRKKSSCIMCPGSIDYT